MGYRPPMLRRKPVYVNSVKEAVEYFDNLEPLPSNFEYSGQPGYWGLEEWGEVIKTNLEASLRTTEFDTTPCIRQYASPIHPPKCNEYPTVSHLTNHVQQFLVVKNGKN